MPKIVTTGVSAAMRSRTCSSSAAAMCLRRVEPNAASSRVAAELIRQGFKAAALKGGIVEWLEAKLPTEVKEAPKQAPPEPGALKG